MTTHKKKYTKQLRTAVILLIISFLVLVSVITNNTSEDPNIIIGTNTENISDIANILFPEEYQENLKNYAPLIDKHAKPINEKVVTTSKNAENFTNAEEVEVLKKFIPQGKYIDINTGIYSEEEFELLNLILEKIEENKKTKKKSEIVKIDSNMGLNSYHKVASYFYIYYGDGNAVSKVFNVVGWNNPFTNKNQYSIKLNYNHIREFEKNRELINKKADEILTSFNSGSEVYILRQISEYLRDNIEYVSGNYTTKSALIDGRATCNGYALAFNLLANRAGIKSDICIALMNDGIWHAWNKVSLSDGSEWFYDITYFDASNSDIYTHSQTPLHTTNYKLNSYTTAWFKE